MQFASLRVVGFGRRLKIIRTPLLTSVPASLTISSVLGGTWTTVGFPGGITVLKA